MKRFTSSTGFVQELRPDFHCSIFCWEHSRVLQVEISGIELATLEISQRSLYIISEVSSKKDNFMQRLEALLY